MLPFDEARKRVIGLAPTLPAQQVTVSDALGRTLHADCHASSALPSFNVSAMDGYAVYAEHLRGAGPWTMPVVGESRAGAPSGTLETNTACRIFTGAALPHQADAVIIQENVERQGDRITFAGRPTSGEHVRKRGSELQQGELVMAAGSVLTPYHLGLLTSLDRVEVQVASRPRVVVLATGDELRTAGQSGPPGSIPESNSIAICALAEQVGAIAKRAPRVGDNLESTRLALSEALASADLVVTIGGVSVGTHDVVKQAMQDAGVELNFWKVKIKPGKPLVVGQHQKCAVLGLPGNPVSAQLTFSLFGLPLLRAMQGQPTPYPRLFTATLTAPLTQKPGRQGFFRVQLEGNLARPAPNQSSGSTSSLAWAHALAIVPAESAGLAAGQEVNVMRLNEM